MAAPPILHLQNIHLTISAHPLLEGAELAVGPGERLALVGRNGSGKSTLLRMAAGEIEPDSGTRFFQPDASIRYLPQEPDMSGFADVQAYVEAGLGPLDDPWRAQYLLHELGLSGEEDPARLSGGEARRAALARVLAPQPDILLLDEPTNHLDLPVIEWLEKELAGLRSAIVLISHDRRFLQTLSRATVWLDRGRTLRMEDNFSAFENWRDTVLEQEELERHKLDRKIVREEDWVRHGVSGRRKRNMRRMGDLENLRSEKREARSVLGNVRLEAAQGQVSGKLVVEAEGVFKRFGERDIVTDFSIRILRRDRIGLAGANGAGKTTLINLLTGKLAPDSGVVRLGSNLELASLDQKRVELREGWTVQEYLTGGGGDWIEINGARKHIAGYMKDFLFAPDQARQPVGKLSGGERGRLMLARALSLPSNFLVLDEPTNDLDLETLDLLQEMIADYPGTVLVVSHDRDFLDRVATSVIVAEGDGRWLEYAGGYSDMVAQRGRGVSALAKAAAEKSDEPKMAVTAPVTAPVAAPAANKRKMTFKEKHALDTLPKRMDELRALEKKLQTELDTPDLYTRDPARFAKVTQALGKAQNEFASAEEQWLELEILREELGG